MKVRDLLRQEIDIDVYDDVCEELGIAFCGPMELTEAGMKEFADVLEYDIGIGDGCVIVKVDDRDERVWRHRLWRAKKLFYSLAGYCDCEQYDAWFKEAE